MDHRHSRIPAFLEPVLRDTADDFRCRLGCPPPELRWPLLDGRLFELHRPAARTLHQHAAGCPQCRLDDADWRRLHPHHHRLVLLWRRLPCRYRVVLAILLLLAGVYLNAARVRVEPGSDWHRSPLNDHWYALTPRAVGWSNARSLARRMGGDLVIIRSSLENQWVAETLLDFETFGAFLGLREVSHEGNWRWVDDSVPTYCNWYLGEPNNDSKGPHDVAMMYGIWDHPLGSWNDTVPGHEPKYLGPTALVTIGIGERKLPPGNLGYLLPALLCGVCALLILFNVLLVLRARRRLRRQAPQLFELIPR